MTNDTIRDPKHDGRNNDPNAGRRTPGHQERPMSEEETRDTASNDSMDASDPPANTPPGKNDPVPSSGFSESDIGGVQGSAPSDPQAVKEEGSPLGGTAPDSPAPDAAEIEWAGGVVRKPPAPDR